MESGDNVEFPVRFIIDDYFIANILKDMDSAVKLIQKLSWIHTKSSHYPFCHNITFDDCFKKAIADKKIRGPAIFGFLKPIAIPDFLINEEDFHSRVIRYAISIGDKLPRKIYIITSSEQTQKYQENPHYKDLNVRSTIGIASGDLAYAIIDIVS